MEEPEEEFIQPMAGREERENAYVSRPKPPVNLKEPPRHVKERKVNEKKKSKSSAAVTGHIKIPINLHKNKEKKERPVEVDKSRRVRRREFNP